MILEPHRDLPRGWGHTSLQIMNAPKGSIFIWCSTNLYYPRDLAQFCKRNDLRVITLHDILREHSLINKYIFDHACGLNFNSDALYNRALRLGYEPYFP